VRIQSLMWDSVLGPDGFYERLLVFTGRRSAAMARSNKGDSSASSSPPCATIIPFPKSTKPFQE